MSLSSTSINRPVLAIVMSLVIIIFGVIGFRYLSIREYPSVDPPIITVSASYTGASADVMQGQVTEPLEEALNGIAGIKNLTSNSRDGRTQITVEFDLDADLESAANDVRDKVAGEREFHLGRKNPHAVVGSGVARRQHEGGFRQARPARVIACICAVSRPSASSTTASGLPMNGTLLKTSTCLKGRGWGMADSLKV